MKNEKSGSVLLVVAATLLWSFGAPIAKFTESSAFTLVFFRSLSGFAFLAFITRVKLQGTILKVNFLYIAGGILYSSITICFYTSLKFTTAANATIIANTSPLFLSLLGFVFLNEKPVLRDWIVLITVFAGMLLCFYGGISLNGSKGDLLALAAAAAFSLLAVIIKKINPKDHLQPLIWGNLIALLLTFPVVLRPNQVIPADIPLFFMMGIFIMAVPFFLYARGQHKLGAMEASLYKLIEPVAAPIWVGFLIGEIPSGHSISGGILVVSALFLNTWTRYRRQNQ